MATSQASIDDPPAGLSVFLRYGANAPADRLQTMRQIGAYRVADDHRDSLLVLHVPPSIARDLARQAWVKGIEIDSSDARPASEVVPWGTDSVNAPLLHAEGLTGAPANHHGTRVAHIIGARWNAEGIRGMAPDALLYSLRVCDAAQPPQDPNCPSDAIYNAINWALSNGIHVLNGSISTCTSGVSAAVKNKIAQAWNAGITLVFGAGNGATTPNCSNSAPVNDYVRGAAAVAIGATSHDQTGVYTPNGQYGPEVDISAPAGTFPNSLPTFQVGGVASSIGNTSGAAAVASGAAALLVGVGYIQPNEVWRRLRDGAIDAGPPSFDHYYGWGRLNVYRARHLIDVAVSGPSFPGEGWHTWTAAVSGGVPPLTYLWERSDFCHPEWGWWTVGTGSTSYHGYHLTGEHYFLRFSATSPALSMTRSTVKLVGGLTAC